MKTNTCLLSMFTAMFILAVGCTGYRETLRDTGAPDAELPPRNAIYVDDFEDRALPGWTSQSGSWRAGRGVLSQSSRTLSSDGEGFRIITFEDLPDDQYRIEVEMRFTTGPRRQAFAGIMFRYQDAFNFSCLRICDFEKYQDRIELYQMRAGQRNLNLGSRDMTVNPTQWYHLALEVDGKELTAWLDGRKVIQATVDEPVSGVVGLATKEAAAEFRRFRVLPL